MRNARSCSTLLFSRSAFETHHAQSAPTSHSCLQPQGRCQCACAVVELPWLLLLLLLERRWQRWWWRQQRK
jgi:hypothetical protein